MKNTIWYEEEPNIYCWWWVGFNKIAATFGYICWKNPLLVTFILIWVWFSVDIFQISCHFQPTFIRKFIIIDLIIWRDLNRSKLYSSEKRNKWIEINFFFKKRNLLTENYLIICDFRQGTLILLFISTKKREPRAMVIFCECVHVFSFPVLCMMKFSRLLVILSCIMMKQLW